jgi:L-fuconolactonase
LAGVPGSFSNFLYCASSRNARASEGRRLDRDFTPEDLGPSLVECGIDKTILIQLHNDIDETEDYRDIGNNVDFIGGVVGWVPLADPKQCAKALDRLAGRGKLVGIRHRA